METRSKISSESEVYLEFVESNSLKIFLIGLEDYLVEINLNYNPLNRI